MIIEIEAALDLCPFCGSSAVMRSNGWFNPKTGQKESAYFWVKCTNKDCAVSPKSSSTQSGAIDAWNKRVA